MVHRFANLEIDVAARELRAGGRVLDVQPRVFDLLVYLARHHERVVPKDELLDAVWPGVIVADGSLQRAVSIARSALAQAGLKNAIRTFSRTGYRLCAEATAQPDDVPPTTAPPSSARKLLAHARKIMADRNPSRETLETATQLIDQAKALDSTDADAWALGSQADCWHIFYTFDVSESRREQARRGALRALALDPRSGEARLAQAGVLINVVAQPAARAEAETMLRELIAENPPESRALELLANVLRDDGRDDEAAPFFMRAQAFNAAGWAFTTASRFDEAIDVADRIVAADPSTANLNLKAIIETWGHENLDAARVTMGRLPASALLDDYSASVAAFIHLYRGEPERVLETLHAIPRDWLATRHYAGPKGWFTGHAHHLAGRTFAAQAEWRSGLASVEQRLASQGNALPLLRWQGLMLALIGEKQEAGRLFDLTQELAGRGPIVFDQYQAEAALLIGRQDTIEAWLKETLTPSGAQPWFMHAVIRFDPAFAPLRSIPLCASLLRDTLPAGATPLA
ncbi:winged helix-turn-helix domain-containing protein [Synoicihabitans lomoniglobus]|uniref:Winged helix-turn-helix domain-containing protein n=1 Tax=Synoicihabitans lomoniglobus TaxID=2909285 RepID=A0AAF0I4K4_9BACT|nr:winged helix-turn-helix domain-containing protein [Opitutaceae bacterium LMO-M01]WED66540.1 winged helix-turn-helix domain-containing protein [Opitutaceae bacterium LMO-M01]